MGGLGLLGKQRVFLTLVVLFLIYCFVQDEQENGFKMEWIRVDRAVEPKQKDVRGRVTGRDEPAGMAVLFEICDRRHPGRIHDGTPITPVFDHNRPIRPYT